jgi:NADPH:quinone reductase-like Zn-dependent oxidoreductase
VRAVVVTKHGGPEVLQVQERPDPTLGRREVLIRVAAAGINFADVMARIGVYPDAPKPPCVVGYEVAGTVVDFGPDVQGVDHGERVVAATEFNGYAEQVVVRAADVIPLPAGMTFEQGAAVPINYATAWSALIGHGNLQPGERVLIHACAGGVGIAATQIAKRHGAEVYGAASPSKHAAIAEIGVDHALDYTQAGWRDRLPSFDIVLDAIGGKSFRTSYELLRPGGRLVAFGAAAVVSGERRNLVSALRTVRGMPRFKLIKQMHDSKSVIGLNLLTEWRERGSIEYWARPLREMLDDGTIRPVIAGDFDFDHAGEAQQMLIERRNVGKVVLVA